jgi:hypothetical protein
MANQYVNKVVLSNGTTLIDLTGDDVKASDVLSGIKFHLPSGAEGTGACTYDADTSDATATAAEILATKTAYKNGAKVTGTMPNRGGVTGTIATKTGQYTVPQGYHDGSGKVSIASAEQAKLIPTNIREGITILGVEGTMSGSEGMKPQAKSATPTFAAQTISPDSPDYNCLSEVTIAAIPVAYSDNAAGGQTCTIG